MEPKSPVNIDYASPIAAPRPRRSVIGIIGWILFGGLALFFLLLMRSPASIPTKAGYTNVTLSEFTTEVNAGTINTADVGDNEVIFTSFSTSPRLSGLPGSTTYRVELPDGTGSDWRFLQWITDSHNGRYQNVKLSVRSNQSSPLINIILPLIPWLLIFGFVWFFLNRQMRVARKLRREPMPVVIVNPEALQ